jgi:hypothetical protein
LSTKFLSALLLVVLTAITVWAQAPAQAPANTAASEEVARITIEELKSKIDKHEKVVVVDVRAHTNSVIKGALHIPLADIESKLDKLPKDRLIVTVCS